MNDEERTETTDDVSRRVRLQTLDDWPRSTEKENLNLQEKGGGGNMLTTCDITVTAKCPLRARLAEI